MPPKRSSLGRTPAQLRAQAMRRKMETSEQTADRKDADRVQTAAARAQLPPELTQIRQITIRRQTASRRLANQTNRTKTTMLIARKSSAIFAGTLLLDYCYVGPLMKGDQTSQKQCEKCHALKWKNEAPRTCCAGGKVDFPTVSSDEPTLFRTLWEGQNLQSKVFKKHCRSLNNALALACLQKETPAVPGGGTVPL